MSRARLTIRLSSGKLTVSLSSGRLTIRMSKDKLTIRLSRHIPRSVGPPDPDGSLEGSAVVNPPLV